MNLASSRSLLRVPTPKVVHPWRVSFGEGPPSDWNENARINADAENAYQRELHQHRMNKVGRPRSTPDELRELVAKKDGDAVARSMVVFGKGGDVFNLKLSPYFDPQPLTPPPSAAADGFEYLPDHGRDDPLAQSKRGRLILGSITAALLWGFFGLLVEPSSTASDAFWKVVFLAILAIAAVLFGIGTWRWHQEVRDYS